MILVCGEALIDFFPFSASSVAEPGGSSRKGDPRLGFQGCVGGSPFNVAVGAARLGIPSAFFSNLSTDIFGKVLKEHLESEGVDLSLCLHSAHSSTLAFVSSGPDGVPEYAFLGEGAADRAIAVADLPPALSDEIKAISFGSFSLAVEPCGSAFEALMRRESKSRIIALDPNVRRRLIEDFDAYRARLTRMISLASVVKVSTEDLGYLDDKSSPEEMARSWADLGPILVIVTDGPNGAYSLYGGVWAHHAAKPIDVVDTVGAGDTFQAAMLSGFHKRGLLSRDALAAMDAATLATVVREAITAASITCGRRGADLPTAADLKTVMNS